MILFAAVFAQAQTPLASVTGVVSDPSGAVVPNVKVTVTDIERGTPYTATTNAQGVYFIKDLIPSTYKVTAEASGFRTYVLDAFPLGQTQAAGLNISLQLGTSSQTVEVSGKVQMVEPTSATLTGTVNSESVVDLPLANRNVLTLMVLTPGVTPSTPNSYQSNFFTSAIRYQFNGGEESTNDFQVDGVSILNQSDIPGIMGLTMLPSVDSVQEVTVQTNDYSAAYGRSGGGITSMVSKSGTNQWHGDGYEFVQNTSLEANSFFSNASGGKIPPLHYSQYGGSVGGPIIKNKLFVFGLLERNYNHSGFFSEYTVPTAAELQGNFAQDYNSDGTLKTIYNPFSTVPDPSNPGQFIRTAVPGNNLQNLTGVTLDPIGQKLASYWPGANLPGVAVTGVPGAYAPINNLGLSGSAPNPLEEITFKVDYNLGSNKHLFLRYGYLFNVSASPNVWHNDADEGYGDMTVRAHNGVLGYTQTFGGASVLDLRAGVNRFWAFRPSNGYPFNLTTLGFSQDMTDYVEQGDVPEFPGVAVQGYSTLGNNNGPYYAVPATDYMFSGSFSRVIGKHTLTAGAEQRDYFLGYLQTNPPTFNFGNDMTQGPNPLTISEGAGDAVASLLLGAGDSGNLGYYARPANANHYFAEYVQDDIKWTRKFTMNIGFRLEEETATTERYNRMAAINPTVLNPISASLTNPATGATPWDVYGGYVFAGSGADSLGRRAIRGVEYKPNPRLGLAYSLNDKTVIRAGYGIFFGVPWDGATREFTGPANGTSTPWVASVDGIHVNTTLNNAFPQGFSFIYPPGTSGGLLTDVGQSLSSGDPNGLKDSYTQQWNLSIQRSLTTNTMLQVAYVGTKGTHMWPFNESGEPSMNQLPPQDMSQGASLLNLVPNPFYGLIKSGGALAQPTVRAGQLELQWPEWQLVSEDGNPIGNFEYDALQVMFQKRYSGGNTLTAGYTWSNSLTDVGTGIWNDAGAVGGGTIRSWYCLHCEHAPAAYETPSRFVLSGLGVLPFGKGKRWGSGFSTVEDALLGGWQVNGILTLASGQPLTFLTASNNATYGLGGGGQHPEDTGIPMSMGSNKSYHEWFNTAAFAQPANFTFGDVARTTTAVRQDWTRNLDASLFKDFKIKERFTIQIRAEAFNFTNTVVFGGPDTTYGTSGFGTINGQANAPRTVQLAAKVLF